MNECQAGHYQTNKVVTHFPLVCFGGYGQPRCQFVDICIKENGIKRRKVKPLPHPSDERKG